MKSGRWWNREGIRTGERTNRWVFMIDIVGQWSKKGSVGELVKEGDYGREGVEGRGSETEVF